MAILFAQYWDVIENKEKQYEEFILAKYIPTYQKTGLRIAGAYYVVVGAGPRIVGISPLHLMNTQTLWKISFL